MSKEVIIRLRDDLDDGIGADIETREFSFAGVRYEIDLSANNYAEMELVIAPYIKAGRKAKRRSKSRATKVVETAQTPHKPYRWAQEIVEFATVRGYDWTDKVQRDAVRAWAIHTGHHCPKTGVVPRATLEAHHEARESGEVQWPFG